MITFETLVDKQRANSFVPYKTLALDPGDTTGYSVWAGAELLTSGEIEGTPAGMHHLFTTHEPTQVALEEYRIYPSHLQQHALSDVPTLRLIGGVEMLAYMLDVPIFKVMASTHKPFCTDEKLQGWGLWNNTFRHANDSIRVGVYYLLFGDTH